MCPDFLLATLARLIAGCLPQPLTVRRLGQAPRLAPYCHRTKKTRQAPRQKIFGNIVPPSLRCRALYNVMVCNLADLRKDLKESKVVYCTTLWSATAYVRLFVTWYQSCESGELRRWAIEHCQPKGI
jgi:hypothetical protein